MKTPPKETTHLIEMSRSEFLASYNKNMPPQFPRATPALLAKFKEEHAIFFKRGDFWSLDQHRKRIMDWLSLNRDLLP